MEQQHQEETLATPGVVDKYKEAGKVANTVLAEVIKKIRVGAKIVDICRFGDSLIEQHCSKIYNKKLIPKGIAFPTCISVNNICGHFSPLPEQDIPLKDGDVVKIDLGAHFDGFMALVAHTIVVQSDPNAPITDKQADVILAAYKGVQAAFRLLKPGNLNNQVTETITKVVESYGVNPLEGVLSHELKKHLMDGNNCIINKQTFEQQVVEHEFQVNEVYALDVIVSSGEGKPKEADHRVTVYKRALDRAYGLKTKHGRNFFNEVLGRYPSLGFSINSFQDEISTKLGVKQALEHDLLQGFPILVEKQGEVVAQFKITVMLLQGGTIAITGLPIEEAKFKTERKITDQGLIALLNTSMDKTEQKKDKKKKVQENKPAVQQAPKVEEAKK